MLIYIALGIAYGVPLIFLYSIRKFDLYGTGKFRVNFLTIFWGFVAYVLAAKINPYMLSAGWASYDVVIRITGPIVEEFLKALILIYLVQRADFNYVVDGALYGFGAGMGFAIIENAEYIFGHPEIAITVAIARVFSTNLVHATGSGLIGTALAFRRGDSSWRGWLVALTGYVLAMSLHMLFNTMVNTGIALFIAIIYGFVGVGAIWYIIKHGMNIQKQWVDEKLGMGDRVTNSEAKVVRNIDDLDGLLEPLKKQFGESKAKTVKEIISKQAEIGIKRKLMDTTPSAGKKKEILEIIQTLGKDMDVLRKEAGPYCMMFVRTVYLDHEIKIWDQINTRIEASNTGEKGGGMFDRVTTRIKRRPLEENNPPQEEKP